jgi:hypothetical protein
VREFDSLAKRVSVAVYETVAVGRGCWAELRVYSLVDLRRFNFVCAPLLYYSRGIPSILLKLDLPTAVGQSATRKLSQVCLSCLSL